MRILIVEDDERLSSVMSALLRRDGYETDECGDGLDALNYIANGGFEAVILDCMLPSLDGLSVLKRIRSADIYVPVLMVTALGEINDRVGGLNAGADDYLVKPFAPEELLARVRALLRRPAVQNFEGVLTYEGLFLDLHEHRLFCCENSVALSRKEAAFMEILISHGGGLVTREEIYAHVWGVDSIVEMGNIDNYVRLLRRRLIAVKSDLEIVNTPRIGYSLSDLKRRAAEQC